MKSNHSVIAARKAVMICKKRNISIQDFEVNIGVAHGYLSRIIRCGRELGLEKLLKMSNILGVSIEELADDDISNFLR